MYDLELLVATYHQIFGSGVGIFLMEGSAPQYFWGPQ